MLRHPTRTALVRRALLAALALVLGAPPALAGVGRLHAPFAPGTGSWDTLPNGGFESGDTSGWTAFNPQLGTFDVVQPGIVGGHAARGATTQGFNGPGFALISAPVPVQPDTDYVLSGFIHTAGVLSDNVYIDLGDASFDVHAQALTDRAEWQFIWVGFRTSAGTSSVTVRLVRDKTAQAGEQILFDEVAVTPAASFAPPDCAPGSTTNSEIYCTAKVNSQGCTPVLAISGQACLSATAPFTISCSDVVNKKGGVLAYGTAGTASTPFAGGTLCLQPPYARAALLHSGGNTGPDDCSGRFALDFNALLQTLGDPRLVAGAEVQAQFVYRDPADATGFGLSDAVRFWICP